MKRYDLVPKYCNRCGNDLMTGKSILHLPFEKRYLAICNVCSKGLGIETLFMPNNPTNDEWKKFWDEEISTKPKK
jgi:hypothetical protein